MGIRTPIIYRWKGVIEPEMDQSSLSSSIDIATTVLHVCGIEPAKSMQGINVLDKEERTSREAIFAEVYAHDFSSIDSSLYHRIIITRPWKLINTNPAYQPAQGPELYNLDEDPFEWNNQAEDHPEIVGRLSGQLEEWWMKDED
jgi:arylsulfatase A-like enzyme